MYDLTSHQGLAHSHCHCHVLAAMIESSGSIFGFPSYCETKTYESNVLFAMRFMVDLNIVSNANGLNATLQAVLLSLYCPSSLLSGMGYRAVMLMCVYVGTLSHDL